jgi:hypothetical protein
VEWSSDDKGHYSLLKAGRTHCASKAMTQIDRKHEVLVSVQQALLGEVSPLLRAVTVDFDATTIRLKCYYDGDVDPTDRESMSQVETELIAYFPESHSIVVDVIAKNYPEPIPKGVIWAFFRRED